QPGRGGIVRRGSGPGRRRARAGHDRAGAGHLRRTGCLPQERVLGLLRGADRAAASRWLRHYRLPGRAGGPLPVASRIRAVDVRRRSRRPQDDRRGAGRHHAVLADQHRGLIGTAVLGEPRGQPHQRNRDEDRADLRPGGRHRLPGRRLPAPGDLGPARLSHPRLLPRGLQGRPLRRLGAAAAVQRRDPGRVQAAPLADHAQMPRRQPKLDHDLEIRSPRIEYCRTVPRRRGLPVLLAGYLRQGPVNLLDPDTIDQLGALIAQVESDPDLTVVVFRSDKPGYFMAHWDFLSDTTRVAAMRPGPTGLHPYLDNFIRLSKLPVATISEIRGRARGAGSEFVLATDIRFASETAVLGQFEVGVGAVPGGGPMARLARLAGRGRALEILLGGDDIPASLAAEYGYVNRVIPDAEIEDATDAFARRIAAFDKVAVTGIKKLVDVATLPANGEFAPGLQAYFTTSGRPQNQPFAQLLLKNGLQQSDGIETDLGTAIGKLRQDA